MENNKFRIETDSLGEVQVPAGAYWGAQTQRAFDNFRISGLRFPRSFIRALGMVKAAAARVNMDLGLLDRKKGEAVFEAAGEVMEGKHDDQFIVDIFQTGSGTSTNMNANEVIANRANERLGGKLGSKAPVHPNDHVNMGQSSNDVIPSCIHISAFEEIEKSLIPSLKALEKELGRKAREFDQIVKIGRTHLQDATPVRLGQEFGGYEAMVSNSIERIKGVLGRLAELAIGGTAVGTGMNTHPEFPTRVIGLINDMSGLAFSEAKNHFEAQGAQDALVQASAALKTAAVSLSKIANDIRFLGCGPRCGIGELVIPAVQPGSSIMPGKVNPVMAESLIQAAAQVIGNDAAVTIGGLGGYLELNLMMPLIAHNLLQSIELLARGASAFSERCVKGLKADSKRIGDMVEKSLALATALSPLVGYDAASKIARESYETGKTVREIAREKKIMAEERLRQVLDLRRMTERGL